MLIVTLCIAVVLTTIFICGAVQELGKKFLKLLKEQQAPLRPFLVAVLLSIAKLQRFETEV